MPAVTTNDVGALRPLVAVGADDAACRTLRPARLPLVQPLALGNAFDHVDHDDGAGQLLFGEALRGGRAHVPRADDGDFSKHGVRPEKVRGSDEWRKAPQYTDLRKARQTPPRARRAVSADPDVRLIASYRHDARRP